MEEVTPFRIGYVPGVMPGKWERVWKDRQRHVRTRALSLIQTEVEDQKAHLLDGTLDMCLARGEADVEFPKSTFHMIALYREQPVVVVGTEHPVAAYEEIDAADLSGEHDVLVENPGLAVRHAIETVAAGTGIVVLPMSLARLHNRKDAVWVPVNGAEEYPVGLAWLKEAPADLSEAARERREEDVQAFIGVVRGRTANSSRG